MSRKRIAVNRTAELSPLAQDVVDAADHLVKPTAKLVGDTLTQSARVVEVATSNFAKLIGREGGSSVSKLVSDTVEESLRVPEVAVKRTWELVDTFWSEAARVAKSVGNRVAAVQG